MTDHVWLRVTACENIPLREGRSVVLGARELAIFNLGDRFLATDNQCPHQGGPLCDGIVTGSSVVCPLHAWKVNLQSGVVERPSSASQHCVTTYPTRIDDGVVVVGLPVAAPATGPVSHVQAGRVPLAGATQHLLGALPRAADRYVDSP